MALKLLAVGDLHLGRRPTRLPEDLTARSHELGPAAAWRRVVDRAIETGVHAVALAGDVVERENDFFEAYRQLQEGVQDLSDAGIRVLGVVGNHDVAVLPRLANQIEAFELLGRGGQWESTRIEAGGDSLELWGWSFPQARVTRSPLTNQVFPPRSSGPRLGLLHCDRDQPGSVYAPVSSRELESAGLDGWLLGHIHAPDTLSAPYPSGYLGSVSGLHPGEHGDRGPWLITVESGRVRSVDQWTLAPLRYQRIEVNLTGLTSPADARESLLEAVRQLDQSMQHLHAAPAAVGLRIHLTGRTRFGEAVLDLLSPEDRAHIATGERGERYFVERLTLATRPEIQLETLAAEPTPPGLLARRLLLLDKPADHPERAELIHLARERLAERAGDRRWSGLRVALPDPEETADYLRESGLRLLESLLAQRERDS